MNLPNVDEVGETLLGWFWIISTRWRDRAPQSMLEHVNEATGLPDRAEDLLPKHRALSGAPLALAVTPPPSGLASSWLRYHADSTVKCTEVADCDGCRELSQKPPAAWDEEEVAAHTELTYRIKLAVRALAAKGLANAQPPDMDGAPMPLGEDGLTLRFALTPEGLEAARKQCAGVARWESMTNVRGWREALTKAEFAKAPAWLRGGA